MANEYFNPLIFNQNVKKQQNGNNQNVFGNTLGTSIPPLKKDTVDFSKLLNDSNRKSVTSTTQVISVLSDIKSILSNILVATNNQNGYFEDNIKELKIDKFRYVVDTIKQLNFQYDSIKDIPRLIKNALYDASIKQSSNNTAIKNQQNSFNNNRPYDKGADSIHRDFTGRYYNTNASDIMFNMMKGWSTIKPVTLISALKMSMEQNDTQQQYIRSAMRYQKGYNFLADRVFKNTKETALKLGTTVGFVRQVTTTATQILSRNQNASTQQMSVIFLQNIYETIRYMALDIKATSKGSNVNDMANELKKGLSFGIGDVLASKITKFFNTTPILSFFARQFGERNLDSNLFGFHYIKQFVQYLKDVKDDKKRRDKVVNKFSVKKSPDQLTADAVSQLPNILENQRIIALESLEVLQNIYSVNNHLLYAATGNTHKYTITQNKEKLIYVQELGTRLTQKEYADFKKKQRIAVRERINQGLKGTLRGLYSTENSRNRKANLAYDEIELLNNKANNTNSLTNLFNDNLRELGIAPRVRGQQRSSFTGRVSFDTLSGNITDLTHTVDRLLNKNIDTIIEFNLSTIDEFRDLKKDFGTIFYKTFAYLLNNDIYVKHRRLPDIEHQHISAPAHFIRGSHYVNFVPKGRDTVAAQLPIGAGVIPREAVQAHPNIAKRLGKVVPANRYEIGLVSAGHVGAMVAPGEVIVPPNVVSRNRGLISSLVRDGRIRQGRHAYNGGILADYFASGTPDPDFIDPENPTFKEMIRYINKNSKHVTDKSIKDLIPPPINTNYERNIIDVTNPESVRNALKHVYNSSEYLKFIKFKPLKNTSSALSDGMSNLMGLTFPALNAVIDSAIKYMEVNDEDHDEVLSFKDKIKKMEVGKILSGNTASWAASKLPIPLLNVVPELLVGAGHYINEHRDEPGTKLSKVKDYFRTMPNDQKAAIAGQATSLPGGRLIGTGTYYIGKGIHKKGQDLGFWNDGGIVPGYYESGGIVNRSIRDLLGEPLGTKIDNKISRLRPEFIKNNIFDVYNSSTLLQGIISSGKESIATKTIEQSLMMLIGNTPFAGLISQLIWDFASSSNYDLSLEDNIKLFKNNMSLADKFSYVGMLAPIPFNSTIARKAHDIGHNAGWWEQGGITSNYYDGGSLCIDNETGNIINRNYADAFIKIIKEGINESAIGIQAINSPIDTISERLNYNREHTSSNRSSIRESTSSPIDLINRNIRENRPEQKSWLNRLIEMIPNAAWIGGALMALPYLMPMISSVTKDIFKFILGKKNIETISDTISTWIPESIREWFSSQGDFGKKVALVIGGIILAPALLKGIAFGIGKLAVEVTSAFSKYIVGGFVRNIGGPLINFFKPFGIAVLEGLLYPFKTLPGQIISFITNKFTGTGTGGLLSKIGGTISEFLGTMFGGLFGKIGSFLSPLTGYVGSLFPRLIQIGLPKLIGGLFNFIFDGIFGGIDGYKKEGLWGMIKGFFEGALTSSSVTGNVIKYALGGLVFGPAGMLVGGLIGAAVQLIFDNWDSIIGSVKGIGNWIGDGISSMWNDFKNTDIGKRMTAIWDGLSNGWSKFMEGIDTIWSFLDKWIFNPTGKAMDWIREKIGVDPLNSPVIINNVPNTNQNNDPNPDRKGSAFTRWVGSLFDISNETAKVEGSRLDGGPIDIGKIYSAGENGLEVFIDKSGRFIQYLGTHGPELIKSSVPGDIYPIAAFEQMGPLARVALNNANVSTNAFLNNVDQKYNISGKVDQATNMLSTGMSTVSNSVMNTLYQPNSISNFKDDIIKSFTEIMKYLKKFSDELKGVFSKEGIQSMIGSVGEIGNQFIGILRGAGDIKQYNDLMNSYLFKNGANAGVLNSVNGAFNSIGMGGNNVGGISGNVSGGISGNIPGNTNFTQGGKFKDNAAPLMNNLMKDYGLTKEQAAGIVGNLSHESAGLVAGQSQIGGGGGLGWAQWTGSRRDDFTSWAAQNNMNVNDPNANYGFLKHELDTKYKGVIPAIKQTGSVAESTRAWHDTYEKSGDIKGGVIVKPAVYQKRLDYANQAMGLNGVGNSQVGPTIQNANQISGLGTAVTYDSLKSGNGLQLAPNVTLAGSAAARGLKGVDPAIVEGIMGAAKNWPGRVEITSGMRGAGDKKNHSGGYAVDIQLYDEKGNKLNNNSIHGGDSQYAGKYETFMRDAVAWGSQFDPSLAKDARWGGYFSKGKAFGGDWMHLDRTPGGAMGGGNWQDGINARGVQGPSTKMGMNFDEYRNRRFGNTQQIGLNPPQIQFDPKSVIGSVIKDNTNEALNKDQGLLDIVRSAYANVTSDNSNVQSQNIPVPNIPNPSAGPSITSMNDTKFTSVDPLGDSIVEKLFSISGISLFSNMRNQAMNSGTNNLFELPVT